MQENLCLNQFYLFKFVYILIYLFHNATYYSATKKSKNSAENICNYNFNYFEIDINIYLIFLQKKKSATKLDAENHDELEEWKRGRQLLKPKDQLDIPEGVRFRPFQLFIWETNVFF